MWIIVLTFLFVLSTSFIPFSFGIMSAYKFDFNAADEWLLHEARVQPCTPTKRCTIKVPEPIRATKISIGHPSNRSIKPVIASRDYSAVNVFYGSCWLFF